MDNQQILKDDLTLPTPQSNDMMVDDNNTSSPTKVVNSASEQDNSSQVNRSNSNDVISDSPISVNQDQSIVNQISIEDNDLIDKEWINRVKNIIEATRGNPYKQSQEINALKAEFILKKYNKVIKVE